MRRAFPERRPSSCGRGWRFETLGLLVVLLLRFLTILPTSAFASPPSTIDFSRDILPILSDNCFLRQGPAPMTRRGDLRLDVKDPALSTPAPVIVPGKSGESELILRTPTPAPDEVMPPPKTNHKLTPRQV